MQHSEHSKTYPADEASAYKLTAAEFAVLNGIKAQSLRARVSRTGSYFGVRPLKCANRRTLWPEVVAHA